MDSKKQISSDPASRPTYQRRQFLRGAGGFSLGLPLLPSLLPRSSWAQAGQLPPCFLAITFDHGGFAESAVYPGDSTLSEQRTLYPGHVIRRGNLQPTNEGGDTVISSILRAPATDLPPHLVQRMSIIRGLDYAQELGHHLGGHLGNNGQMASPMPERNTPTIDQLLAWSPSFYGDLTGIRERAMAAHMLHAPVSYGFSSPSTQTGTIQGIRNANSPSELFDRIFVRPTTPEPGPARRPTIVDRVLENYRRLRQSDRRISSNDRQRLDDHLERLAELERHLNVTAPVRGTAACAAATRPSNASDNVGNAGLFAKVMATAFACGTSRIGVMGLYAGSGWAPFTGNWHQDIAHNWGSAGPQAILQAVNRSMFQKVFVTAMKAMDVESSPGRTLLDDSLMMWTNESGWATHGSRGIPVVIAGAAGGKLRTGQYVDLTNRTTGRYGQADGGSTGLMYGQWLATVLQTMGMQRSQFQNIPNNASTGYGAGPPSSGIAQTHVPGVRENASDLLPYVAVGA